MGLFSKVKKAFKKVTKGVKKVFKKATKFVGKIAGSKWGKALMIAGAAVMGGIALYGAYTGWTAAGVNATFGAKVASSVSGMVNALASPVATGKEMFGAVTGAGNAVPAAQGMEALGLGGTGLGEAASAAQTTAGVGQAAFGAPAGMSSIGQAGLAAGQAGATQAAAAPGLLGRAAAGAWDFAKSAGGAQIISGAIGGIGEAKMREKELEQQERMARYYDEQWRDPKQLAAFQQATAGANVQAPTNMAQRLQDKYGTTGLYGTPLSPDELAAYARG